MLRKACILTSLFVFFVLVLSSALGAERAFASTNITVTTTQDVLNGSDGLCSLREAVIAANTDAASGGTAGECPAGSGADTINLPAGTYTFAITGTDESLAIAGDLDITNPLKIVGELSSTTVIDAAKLDRVIEVFTSGLVQIQNLTLRNGQPSSAVPNTNVGGGVFNSNIDGQVLIEDTIVRDNYASFGGGGIYSVGALTMTRVLIYNNLTVLGGGGGFINGIALISDSVVMSNTATSASFGDGGGLVTQGIVTIKNSSVVSNTSARFGGAIFTVDSRLLIENSELSNNKAVGGVGGGLMGNWGFITLTQVSAVNNSGGAFYVLDPHVEISDSVIHGNSRGIDLVNYSGANALRNRSNIVKTIVSGNGSGIVNGPTGSQIVGGNVSITESLIANNTSNGLWNLGVMTVTNSTISQNNANEGGGALNIGPSGQLLFINSTIVSNTALTGGGVSNANSGVITLSNSLIAGNIATSSNQLADCSGVIISLGYNLIQSTCNLSGTLTGNQVGVNPLIGPLANNGGPTLTHALLIGSSAIDTGDPNGCLGANGQLLVNDQRGNQRPVDGDGDNTIRCDIGAFEYSPVTLLQLFLPLIRR